MGYIFQIDNNFWLVLFIIFGAILFLYFLFGKVMRRALGVEKKYQGETNNYKYTLAEVAFLSLLFILMIATDFFGLININA